MWIFWVLAVPAIALLALVITTRLQVRSTERRLRPEGRWTKVPGGLIHWTEAGAGPPIVLIHGLSGNHRNFTYAVAGELARTHRVIAIDRPGCGHSKRDSAAGADIFAQADMIAAFLKAEQLTDATVIGHSLGGAITSCLAARHPDALAAFGLITPLSVRVDTPPAPFKVYEIQNAWLRAFLAHTIVVPLGALGMEKTLKHVFSPEAAPADFPIRGGGLLALRPAAFIATSEELTAIPDAMTKLQKLYTSIKIPGGILNASADVILPPQVHGETLAGQIPNLIETSIDGAGHMLPVTQPEQTVRFIRQLADRQMSSTEHETHTDG